MTIVIRSFFMELVTDFRGKKGKGRLAVVPFTVILKVTFPLPDGIICRTGKNPEKLLRRHRKDACYDHPNKGRQGL
jgi:hypothetical protein